MEPDLQYLIASMLRDNYKWTVDKDTVLNQIRILEDEGVIEIVFHGKPGKSRGLANEYRFLNWKNPENQDTLTQPPAVSSLSAGNTPHAENTQDKHAGNHSKRPP